MKTESAKKQRLASFLGTEPCYITSYMQEDHKNHFSFGAKEYIVLDSKEADKEMEKYIINSLLGFDPSFMSKNTKRSFMKDAISTYGRGYFLSPQYGKEYSIGNFFIYRIH